MSTRKQQTFTTIKTLFNFSNKYDNQVLQLIETIHNRSITEFDNIKYRVKIGESKEKNNIYLRFILELLCSEFNEHILQFLKTFIISNQNLLTGKVIIEKRIKYPSLIEYAIVLMGHYTINKTYFDVLLEYKKPQAILYSYDGYEYKTDERYDDFGLDQDDFIKLGSTFGIMVARSNVSLEDLYFLNNQSKHEYALSYCNYWFHMCYKHDDIVDIDIIEQIINFYCDNDLKDINFNNIDFYHYADIVDRWINDGDVLIKFNDKKYSMGDNLLIIFIIIVYMLLQYCDEYSINLLKKLKTKYEDKIRAAFIFLTCVGEDNINNLVSNNYKTLMEACLVDNTTIIFVKYDYDEYIMVCSASNKKILEYDDNDHHEEISALKNTFYRIKLHDDVYDYNKITTVDYKELYKHCFSPCSILVESQ